MLAGAGVTDEPHLRGSIPLTAFREVEQEQLVGPITRRSVVQIHPSQLMGVGHWTKPLANGFGSTVHFSCGLLLL